MKISAALRRAHNYLAFTADEYFSTHGKECDTYACLAIVIAARRQEFADSPEAQWYMKWLLEAGATPTAADPDYFEEMPRRLYVTPESQFLRWDLLTLAALVAEEEGL